MSRLLDTAMHVHSAALRLLRAVRTADAETGVSAPKLSALSVLTFGGAMSLSALAKAEQVRAPTMSKLVADLEAEGLALMEEGRKKRLALLTKRLTRLSAAERAELHNAADLMLRLASSDERA
jgi:DNA-binding MarR family transcriptional regulator